MLTTKSKFSVRWMIQRDMPDVLAIEAAGNDYAWSEQEILNALRQRDWIGMVAFDESERVVGYMIYRIETKKHRIRVFKFAVASDRHREGVGRRMVERLKEKLSAHKWRHLAIVVRERSFGAMFFSHMGFRATKVLREHFGDSGEDGYVMRFDHQGGQGDVSIRA